MRVIPAETGDHVASDGERRVHRLLREVRLEGWTALHSLRLSKHEYQMVGEIDFLLVGPDGLFVIEVKGGRVGVQGGLWVHTDRFGVDHRTGRSPFEQAQRGAFSILRNIEKAFPRLGRVRLGWAVSFPDQPFHHTSVEWDRAEVIDRPDHESVDRFESAIRRMIQRSRRSDERVAPQDLSRGAIDAILELCRPEFDRVPKLSEVAGDMARESVRLTASQYRYLDVVEVNDRILCTGGAGTGKTLLALEVARREAAAGRSTVLTARSRQVTGLLGSLISGAVADKASVVPFDQLGSVDRTFDTLVVDEGQDLMNFGDLDVLDRRLEGGMADGRWRVFLDQNHQRGLLGDFDDSAFELIMGPSTFRLHLPDNCRNPRTIVSEVREVLGVDVGGEVLGAGPGVIWRFYEDVAEGAEEAAGAIRQLLDDGASKRDILLLTDADPMADPVIACLPDDVRGFVHPVDERTPWRTTSHVRCARLALFKGLEAPFVIMLATGGEGRSTDVLRNTLYVGMTRATAGLHMILPRHLRHDVGGLRAATNQLEGE